MVMAPELVAVTMVASQIVAVTVVESEVMTVTVAALETMTMTASDSGSDFSGIRTNGSNLSRASGLDGLCMFSSIGLTARLAVSSISAVLTDLEILVCPLP